jgi:hypothetical protein
MSSSLLLTITESHGFRALLAAIVWLIGAIQVLGRGLRNLSCRKMQLAAQNADHSFWSRFLQGGDAYARQVPVLWFDTSGGREGPVIRGFAPQSLLVHRSLSNSHGQPLGLPPLAGGRPWSGFRT